jgi:phage shock protein C
MIRPMGGGGMKRLCKSRKNKVIAGVCGGIAEYFEVDPVLIRLIAVLFFFAGGAALIAYIVGMIIIPNQPSGGIDESEKSQAPITASPGQTEGMSQAGSLIIGVIMIVFGIHFLMRNIPFLHQFYWRFWDMGWHFFWPSILILVGLLIILRGVRK